MRYYFLILLYVCLSDSSTIHDKIYRKISSFNYCFRRFNATHQIGCASARNGNVGVLHYVNDSASLSWLLDYGSSSPYIVMLTSYMFNRTIIDQLRYSGKINGIMVTYKNDDESVMYPDTFSPDEQCPNSAFDLYSDSSIYRSCQKPAWNVYGNSMMFSDYQFPIVAMTNVTEIDILLTDCYEKFNKPSTWQTAPSYPLCSVKLKNAMDGAKDTPTCVRRSNLQHTLNSQQYCDPLGSDNIYAFLPPMVTVRPFPANSVILLAARIDTFSQFENMYPAADGAVAGFVTLLSVASAIGKVKAQLNSTSRPLLFTFFNGESFDYIGSQRLLYDMERGKFPYEYNPNLGPGLQPINISHIGYFIELGQVALPQNGKLFLHSDPISMGNSLINRTVSTLRNLLRYYGSISDLEIDDAPEGQRLPPASAHTFLKKQNISTVFVADHYESFSNRYYHSHLDNPETINHVYPNGTADKYNYVTPAADLISRLATSLARALYNISTGSAAPEADVLVDNKTVTNLLYCFLVNASCDLLETVSRAGVTTGAEVDNLYVGVYRGQGSNRVRLFIQSLLAYYLGTKAENKTIDSCNNELKQPVNPLATFMWMQGPLVYNESSNSSQRIGYCMMSNANRSLAISPAFEIDNYDWASNQYSSWTESIWANDAQQIEYFLVPSKSYEVLLIIVGLLFTGFSIFLCWFVKSKSELLFNVQSHESSE